VGFSHLDALAVNDFQREPIPLVQMNLSAQGLKFMSAPQWLTHLTSLDLSNNQLKDMSFVSHLYQAELINLDGNRIHSVQGIKYLQRLRTLSIRDNAIMTLMDLEEVFYIGDNLRKLNVAGNPIATSDPKLPSVIKAHAPSLEMVDGEACDTTTATGISREGFSFSLHCTKKSFDLISVVDIRFMKQAIELARLCDKVDTAYCVGALIVAANNTVLSTGYSRELPGNTHAEECALSKLKADTSSLKDLTLYTTMEPCTHRLSGKMCCADRIVQGGRFHRVVIGTIEPDKFVADCRGVAMLRQEGYDVTVMASLASDCLTIAQ
jgi:pyrimidine deaminase RibD-like protein